MFEKNIKFKDVSNDDPVFIRLEKIYDSTNDGQVIRDIEKLNMYLFLTLHPQLMKQA